jgi:exodeoxyribonuclease V alpha subunit
MLDESSMLDLDKLNTLLSVIKFTPKLPKRIIIVGEPTAAHRIGQAFHDMIGYVLTDTTRANRHYVNLKSNCRQENDPTIIALADAFTDKRRYVESPLDLLNKTGWVSAGLHISRWSDTRTLNDTIQAAINDLFTTRRM